MLVCLVVVVVLLDEKEILECKELALLKFKALLTY